MRPLSASELLAVWEENGRRPPLWQGLALLAVACPDERIEALAQAPIGRYNERLLTLHLWHFGPALTAVTNCPGCGELVEVTLDVAGLCAQAAEGSGGNWLEIAHDGATRRFRLPSPDDLVAAGEATTTGEAGQIIVRRCVETPGRYQVQIHWDSLESHMVKYRQGPIGPEFRALVMPFFVEPPQMQHFENLAQG